MKFVDFVAKINDDPDMVLDLAQMAWAAQAKAKALVKSGSLDGSRHEFDALAQFFAPADPPEFIFSNWEEATWPIK